MFDSLRAQQYCALDDKGRSNPYSPRPLRSRGRSLRLQRVLLLRDGELLVVSEIEPQGRDRDVPAL